MVGIDVTMFDNLLPKCKLYLSDCSSELAKLQNNLNLQGDCYKGKCLDSIFLSGDNTQEFKQILDTLESYENTLRMVEKSYMKQEELIASQLNILCKNMMEVEK